MSSTIDQRVVEMRFDNKQFESGVKESMSTLDRLKEALKFSTSKDSLDGLQKATKNIDLSSISQACDTINDRFSAMGIIGARVLENLTDKVMSFASNTIAGTLGKAFNFVKDSIISGGIKRATNIENAHFQLQALLKDETKVQAVMDNAMESVDGTAYAYDEAAKAASQFAASGVESGDKMLNALKGITGVAAMTNSDFESISRIFTTVAGNGRMMGDQLLQLSSRGLNAASTIKDYFNSVNDGTAKVSKETEKAIKSLTKGLAVSEGDIREWVSKGKISFNMFSEAMTDAFGESAKRANETFTGAFSNMKSALARIGAGFFSPIIEQNGELVQLFNALRIQINNVKSALVFDEATSAISGLSKITGQTTEEMKTLFNDIKNGDKSINDLFGDLEKKGKNGYEALTTYVNGVNDGSIRASYAVKQAVSELQNQKLEEYIKKVADGTETASYKVSKAIKDCTHDGVVNMSELQKAFDDGKLSLEDFGDKIKLTQDDIKKAIEDGTVDFQTFQAAMENAFGDQKNKLSRQFTDTVQDILGGLTEWINNLDLTKPMEIFYNNIESIKNILKGLGTVLGPIGQAFIDAFFPPGTMDKMVEFSKKVEEFTSKLRLSEKSQKNLHDAFKGVFDVVKLVIDIFLRLIGVTTSVTEPMGSLLDVILAIAGAFGRALSAAVEWIRNCVPLQNALDAMGEGFRIAMHWLANLGSNIKDLAIKIWNMEGTQKLISALEDAFVKLGKALQPAFAKLVEKLGEAVGNLIDKIRNFNFADFATKISNVARKIKEFWDAVQSGGSGIAIIDAFVNWIKRIGENMAELDFSIARPIESLKNFFKAVIDSVDFGEAISAIKDGLGSAFEWLGDKIGVVGDKLKQFKDWFTNNIVPLFSGVTVGGVVGTAAAGGLFYAIIKIVKTIENLSNTFSGIGTSLSGMLDSVAGALQAYQKKLKADALIKTAGAIGILAAALIALTFVDSGKLMASAIALGIVAGVFMFGFSKLQQSIDKGNKVKDALNTLASGLSKSMQNLAKSVKIKAIGKAVKDFAASIVMIAVSIIALGIMYSKDKEALLNGAKLVGVIGICLGAIMGLSTLLGSLGKGKGAESFKKSATGMLAIALSLTLIIRAFKKVLALDLPEDWKKKLAILMGLLAGLAGLSIALGIANRISGGGKLGATGPIVAMCLLLTVIVGALQKLFKMDLPDDWLIKVGILAGIMAAMGVLAVILGVAGGKANGAIKAAGTILAMCAFIAVVVGALIILSVFPGEKLLKGAVALGIILITLGLSLAGAGKVVNKDTYKSILAMALDIAVIVAALGILSIIPLPQLAKAAIVLGSMLLLLAHDLKAAAKIANGEVWKPIVAMCAAIGVITVSLHFLAKEDWKSLLAGAVALSGVLLAFSRCMKIISDLNGLNLEKVGLFLLGTVAIAAIGAVLALVAHFADWQNLLAAGASVAAVLLVYTNAFNIISNADGVSAAKVGEFLLGTIAIVVIGAVLALMAKFANWEGLLAAGASVSAVLLAYTAAFAILSKVQINPDDIAAFLLGCVGVAAVGGILAIAAQQPWQNLLAAGVSISIVLLVMSLAMGICSLVGAAAPAAIGGILLLDAFIANFALVLAALGRLSEIPGFNDLIQGGASVLANIGNAIGAFVGNIIAGLAESVASALPAIGQSLADFMNNAKPFFEGVSGIDEGAMHGVKMLAETVLILTGADILQGLTSWLTGGTSLADFGKELEEFGPHIQAFSDSVANIDGANVEAAANAAKTMAEVAKNLPNNGGLAGKIFGENNISEFGEELALFGPSLKKFATSVEGISAESVETAANCAKMMSEMATNLPNSGGLAAKILGDNTLSAFGVELEAFGPHMKAYANEITGIKPEVVEASANCAMALAQLANNLPNSGGFISLFTGDNTLSGFGKQLAEFGKQFKAYYNEIAGIDPTIISSTMAAITALATIAKLDFSGLEKIPEQLKKAGDLGVKEFCAAFTKSGPQIATAIQTFTNNAINALQVKTAEYLTKGSNSASQYLQGFKNKYAEASTVGQTFGTRVLTALQLLVAQFLTKGTASAAEYLRGIKNKYTEAQTTGQTLANRVLSGIQSQNSSFTEAGSQAGQGFVNGIESWFDRSSTAGRTLANRAYTAAQRALDERSPSRKMAQVGSYAGEGFVLALTKWASKAYLEGGNLGDSALDGLSKTISAISALVDDDDLISPVITPVVDMTNVTRSVNDISKMFNNAINLTANTANLTANSISRNNGQVYQQPIQDQYGVSAGNTYNFIQNNNSPKALSRIDIYRQTKSQFTAFREAVETS